MERMSERTCHKTSDAHSFSLLPATGDGLGEENTQPNADVWRGAQLEHLENWNQQFNYQGGKEQSVRPSLWMDFQGL